MADPKERAFSSYRAAFSINLIVCILQWIILAYANSVSLYADAAHSIADSIVLLGSTIVSYQAMLLPDRDHSHIKRRMTRIAVILLWLSVPFILYAAWERIHSSVSFPGIPVVIAATVSVVGNIWMHRIVHSIDKHSHDHLVAANLVHILGDAALSAGVLVSALLVLTFHTGQYDGYIGIGCACWMTIMGIRIWKNTSDEAHSQKKNAREHSCDHHH